MQVWRMKADGSEQTQMTFEESNNWFPHVSPNGKKVCYISYKKKMLNLEAIREQECQVNVMKAKEGKPEVLVELLGDKNSQCNFLARQQENSHL